MPLRNTELLSEVLQKHVEDHFDGKLLPFARKCGMSRSYLSEIIHVRRANGTVVEPTMETLLKLSQAMGMSLEELLGRAGYLEPQAEDVWRLRDMLRQLPGPVRELMRKDDGDRYIVLAEELRREQVDPEALIAFVRSLKRQP